MSERARVEYFEPLLTGDEAAARLGISERTLRKLRQAGAISYHEISDRIIRYSVADCEAFLTERKRTDTPCPSPSKTRARRISNMTSSGTSGGFIRPASKANGSRLTRTSSPRSPGYRKGLNDGRARASCRGSRPYRAAPRRWPEPLDGGRSGLGNIRADEAEALPDAVGLVPPRAIPAP